MSAVVATNVVIARASARASRVSRLARAATAPRSIAPDNVALDRARLVRCRAEGEEKDTAESSHLAHVLGRTAKCSSDCRGEGDCGSTKMQ